jgi:hypothetical protein
MKMEQEFYITLPSNVKSNINNETNTISSYKTFLKKKITFHKEEKWKVGLAEISYTKSWYNVNKKHKIQIFDFNGSIHTFNKTAHYEDDVFAIKDKYKNSDVSIDGKKDMTHLNYHIDTYIKPGYYNSVELLCQSINESLSSFKGDLTECPKLTFDVNLYKIKLHAGCISPNELKEVVYPELGEEINNILGLVDNKNKSLFDHVKKASFKKKMNPVEYPGSNFNKGFHEGFRCADLNAGLQSLFIYSNIVDHSLVGNELAQLLRIVENPSNKKYGDVVTIEYQKPHFIPLQSNSFDSIELESRDDTSQLIKFNFGRVIIKLIFKKYE